MDKVIEKTIEFVKEKLSEFDSSHDWWHTFRVWNLAKHISKNENVNFDMVQLGALLHDVAESKFYEGDETIGPKVAKDFLEKNNVDEKTIQGVINIIKYISFKGGNFNQEFKSKELDIVQDADRIDALGAIGIARTFNYGGYKGREIYNPDIKPNLTMSREEYKKNNSPTLNHFYEKLLRLKDKMNTKVGKELAEERHNFMLKYLDQFYSEWNFND